MKRSVKHLYVITILGFVFFHPFSVQAQTSNSGDRNRWEFELLSAQVKETFYKQETAAYVLASPDYYIWV